DAGLSAPEVYAADPSQGLALIEDLGDDLFARVAAGDSEAALYRAAVDVLVAMRARAPERPAGEAFTMLDYDGPALLAEAELLADWYWPLRAGAAPASDEKSEYMELFRILLDDLAPPHSFVLRDYHAENLLWLPEREGVARVGLIDFQDALYGAAAYDLVSLLEDARRDVAPELAHAMIDRYCARAKETGAFDEAAFRRDYALLAAQRNAKILGIFARLAKRDGKPRYLDLLPRVEAHFQRDLLRPELAPLRRFFADRMPALAS
ncbi:MAG: aminoglycoside phosphotransferase family protein, partial [Hyphococcus sp.]